MSGKQCGKVPRMSYELENCKARKRGGGVGYRGGRGTSAESWRVLFLGRRSPGEPFIPGHSGLSVVGSQCTDENVKSTYAGEKKKKIVESREQNGSRHRYSSAHLAARV